jgi:hypothetical protein
VSRGRERKDDGAVQLGCATHDAQNCRRTVRAPAPLPEETGRGGRRDGKQRAQLLRVSNGGRHRWWLRLVGDDDTVVQLVVVEHPLQGGVCDAPQVLHVRHQLPPLYVVREKHRETGAPLEPDTERHRRYGQP